MFKVAERKVKPQATILYNVPQWNQDFDCNHYRSNCSDNVLLHCRKLHHLSDVKKEVDVTRDGM